MSNKLFTQTSFPTHPVQDKLGQLLIQFGLTKLEYSAIHIGAGLTTMNGGKVEPEVIAEESVNIAMAILEKCHEEMIKPDIKTAN